MRRRDSFDRTSLVASLGIHAALLTLVLWGSLSGGPPTFDFVSYHIELVSPPPVRGDVDQSAEEELVVETPDPTPPQEEERTEPVVEEKPRRPETKPTPPADPVAEPAEERRPATSPEAAEESTGPGGSGVNVRMEGLRRDYPKYYDNIITQILRCFRWQGQGHWETTVYFVIDKDGTVRDLDFVKRSGNVAFDFEAMGAVDCAGKGRFGALPDDFPWDFLPVQFKFQPQEAIRDDASGEAPTTPGAAASER